MQKGLKPGGFVRHVDQLGRVVLPMEWRKVFEVVPGAPMEMIPGRDGTLTLKRYVPSGTCTFCGEDDQVRHFEGRPICRTCADKIAVTCAR